MAFKDRVLAVVTPSTNRSTTHHGNNTNDSKKKTRNNKSKNTGKSRFSFKSANSSSSALSSKSSIHTKTFSSPSGSKNSSASSSISSLFRHLRTRSAATEEEWVDPPLKYSDPPQQEYVDLLAAWGWDAASGPPSALRRPMAPAGRSQWEREEEGQWRRTRRVGSWESDVSPGTSIKGSWI